MARGATGTRGSGVVLDRAGNTQRAVHPALQASASKVIGAPDSTQWFPDARKTTLNTLLGTGGEVPGQEVEPSTDSGMKIPRAYARGPEETAWTQGRSLGDDKGGERPDSLREFPIAHAPGIVKNKIQLNPTQKIDYAGVSAGGNLTCRYLLYWSNANKTTFFQARRR